MNRNPTCPLRHVSLSLLVFALTALAAACRPRPRTIRPATPTAVPVAARPVAPPKAQAEPPVIDAPIDTDAALGHKLDVYVGECLNRFSERVLSCRERYFSWANPRTGPTGREQNIYGLYEIADPAPCAQAVLRAASQTPSRPELESAGQAYVTALTRAQAAVSEIRPYYERGDYRDDRMARGRGAHPRLVETFDAFMQAHRALTARVDEIQERLDAREIARLQADPSRRFQYLMADVRVLAKRLIRLADQGELSRRRTLVNIDMANFQPLVAEYERAVDELVSYSRQHAGETSGLMMFGSYLDSHQALLVAYKAVLRRVRDGRPFDSMQASWLHTSAGWMVEGSPDAARNLYNRMINSHNMLSR